MSGVRRYLEDVTRAISALPLEEIEKVVELLLLVHHRGGKVFILGNGGSAATASHFACDLAKGTWRPGAPGFRVIALTDNVPLITAWANDVDYREVFASQLAPLLAAGDLVIGISGSGSSSNVLRAMEVARERGALTVGFTGARGERLRMASDLCVMAPSERLEQIEDAHLVLEHLICTELRERLAVSDAAGRDEPAVLAIERLPVKGPAPLWEGEAAGTFEAGR